MPPGVNNKLEIVGNYSSECIGVIGGGIIGSTTALHLAMLGYTVELFDPELKQTIDYSRMLSGTKASLGVLMGYVYRRDKGRSWNLRKRSMELWPNLLSNISTIDNPLRLDTPLIQLARSEHEAKRMEQLAEKRKDLGLKFFHSHPTTGQSHCWPKYEYGGLISKYDGRIDPLELMIALIKALDKHKVQTTNKKICRIDRVTSNGQSEWQLKLDNGQSLNKKHVVICAAAGTETLLKPLGHHYPLEPILGQVLHLEIDAACSAWSGWPAVLINNGINLIPHNQNELLIGATVEPGITSNHQYLINMKELNGASPNWLRSSCIKNHWKGLRVKPINEPAPLLKNLEPGLILNTAHYRNGILLAPACAEWVSKEIQAT